MINSKFNRKTIGDKHFNSIQSIESPIISKKVISEPDFITNGEDVIVIKNVDECKVILNSDTTDHIVIKSLTKVLVTPNKNLIDDYYHEIFMEKGACVEFCLIEDVWYILSSDGLKLI